MRITTDVEELQPSVDNHFMKYFMGGQSHTVSIDSELLAKSQIRLDIAYGYQVMPPAMLMMIVDATYLCFRLSSPQCSGQDIHSISCR
jgi:hypothetical protein